MAWVDAADAPKTLDGLAQVAATLGVVGPGGDLPGTGLAVRRWLETSAKKSLVILDDVTDVDMLRPYLPAGGRCHVALTSTQQAAAALGTPVPVDAFTEDEALRFLADRAGLADTPQARELAGENGWLPLALAQAAAVISAQGLGPATYLERLRTLTVDEYLVHSEGEPYRDGIAQAVRLSLLKLGETPAYTCEYGGGPGGRGSWLMPAGRAGEAAGVGWTAMAGVRGAGGVRA